MFTVSDVVTERGNLQYREEKLTGLRCRISPERLKRQIDQVFRVPENSGTCPFCEENIFSITPTFADGNRILRGESVTFPNMFPFAEWHTVTVITRDHSVSGFTRKQIAEALMAQTESLLRFDGYPGINWNFLPSAGASIVHPHIQGISDKRPTWMTERYISACEEYYRKYNKRYWDTVREQERVSDRYLFGDEIFWSAHAVPLGEREIRGVMPISRLDEFESYIEQLSEGIVSVISLYEKLGTHAFNMSVYFNKEKTKAGFCAFCSLISRINPNPLSTCDSAYMERLHGEPVILTLPEDLGRYYRNGENSSLIS